MEFDLSLAIPQSEDTGVPQYAFSEPRKRKQKTKFVDISEQETESSAIGVNGDAEETGVAGDAEDTGDARDADELSKFD